MPIYEYRCANDHTFEVFRSMADDPVTECEECGAPVERVFHPVAVHYKGSGFYSTDYAKKASENSSSAAGKAGDADSKKSEGSDSKKSETKSEGSKASD